MRKAIAILCTMLFLSVSQVAYGADTGVSAAYDPRTGDSALDTTLGDLNAQTHGRDLSEFISNLSVSFNIPRTKIEDLLYKVKMTAADVYMAVGLARIIKQPVDVVVAEYETNKGSGWGVIAKRLGIKPGSKEFQELKKGGTAQLEKAKGKGKDQDQGKGKKKPKRGKGQKKK